MQNWKEKKLKSFLAPSTLTEKPQAGVKYRLAGIRMWGGGVYERETIDGSATAYQSFTLLEKGDLIYNKIWVRHGAVGVVPDALDGCYATSEFPVYKIDREQVLPAWMKWATKQKSFWEQCDAKAHGSSGKSRIKPELFLNLTINVPSTSSEQEQIIAHLEQVQSTVAKIKCLRIAQQADMYSLRDRLLANLAVTYKSRPISEVLVSKREEVQPESGKLYQQITVRMNHKGVTSRGWIPGEQIGSAQFLADEGDFIISKIDARNGAMGLVPAELQDALVTGDFPLFQFTEEVNPRFFHYFSNTPVFDNACRMASEGTTNRKRLKLGRFHQIQIPDVPMSLQNETVAILDKLDTMRSTQHVAQAELDLLLPSALDKAFRGEL